MTYIVHFPDVTTDSPRSTGGKFFALARMANEGFTVPKGICISVNAYDRYVTETGLRERILMELNRKDFEQMRWEEMWDAALRIRNMFLHTPMPDDLAVSLEEEIMDQFGEKPVTVRSSAPGEDAANTSFAGLHESYVNIRGSEAVLAHVIKVWSSLWSDAALLYRRELGLDPATASMAVVVQQMVSGDRSGVAFGSNPNDESQAVVESVYGLNQGMVDGTIEPDRWILDRSTGEILSHVPAERKYWMVPFETGFSQEVLPEEKASAAPLFPHQVKAVYETVMAAEKLFGAPQDVEWTFLQERLYMLQSRPITTLRKEQKGDDRGWYLSLRRSFENLKSLRREIEGRLIPQMIAEAERLSGIDLKGLNPRELATEIEGRTEIYDHWVKTYWDEFIPFAHGARLFGQVYNDAVKPDDPHEFMTLLAATKMESLKRNQALVNLALHVRNNGGLKDQLESEHWSQLPADFENALNGFIHRYGNMMCHGASPSACRRRLMPIIMEMSAKADRSDQNSRKDVDGMVASFLDCFEGNDRREALELLELARSSYQLRDDDNIHLGRIEDQLNRVLAEARERLRQLPQEDEEYKMLEKALQEAENSSGKKTTAPKTEKTETDEIPFNIKPRQLIGQPAGPGVAGGPARVINSPEDLAHFKAGEVLICDAVDPNMTYVVPLCAAIVERRGGMLIHGAIIAREYGIPCVTGVPDVTRWIKNGDMVTVDGHLGIVIIGT